MVTLAPFYIGGEITLFLLGGAALIAMGFLALARQYPYIGVLLGICGGFTMGMGVALVYTLRAFLELMAARP